MQRESSVHRPYIPMSSPDITAADIEAVTQVLQTPYLSIGPRIDDFEEHFASYIRTHHAVGVPSGTVGFYPAIVSLHFISSGV